MCVMFQAESICNVLYWLQAVEFLRPNLVYMAVQRTTLKELSRKACNELHLRNRKLITKMWLVSSPFDSR